MINPGEYNKKIKILSIVESEDKDGYKKYTETVVLDTFAKVKTTKGFTLIANNTDFEKAYTNFTIRYSKKVEETYEKNRKLNVKYKEQLYSIEYMNNIDETNIELEMQCKKVIK